MRARLGLFLNLTNMKSPGQEMQESFKETYWKIGMLSGRKSLSTAYRIKNLLLVVLSTEL